MKRYITHLATLLVCLLGTTSCYEVIEYGEPQRTQFGADMLSQAEYSMGDAAHRIELAIHLNDWLEAATPEERYEIEDYYFSCYKIRQSAEKITLQKMGLNTPQSTTTIITNNSSIEEADGLWTMVVGYDTITLANQGEACWAIRSENNCWGNSYNLTFQLTSANRHEPTFHVVGSGYSEAFGLGCKQIAYRIDKQLCFTLFPSKNGCTITAGTMTLEAEELQGEDAAYVTFTTSGDYEITYRGHRELYNNPLAMGFDSSETPSQGEDVGGDLLI